MQTKLTLRLDDRLIEQAKSYATQTGQSISKIVADYFRLLNVETGEKQLPTGPITQSLRGILREANLDKGDYEAFLEAKHR